MLLEALVEAGRLDEARDCLNEAHTSLDATEGHLYESELYRLEGQLILKQSKDAAAAQACFEKAVIIARSQGARSLELRAITCLARLLQEQGRPSDARQLLEPVLQGFSEGQETADLRRASSLLCERAESG
ncbi:tetratricopeptide repeat protein [Marinobacterium aestuariivivens]|uniref:Tetratricopeptide repeat protein n=1 Tax=Marinobacterium aestuariivivens TaxID=1698799 RepID=A0ABW2A672_9GAMM